MQFGTTESRHKCLIYDGHPAEQLAVVVPLLLDGLEDNWRCLYLGPPETIGMLHDALERRGVDVAREIERRALLLSSDRTHLRDGTFDPVAMVDGLCSSVDEAVRDGYGGLCATGDMRWELGDDVNFERLREYESRLDRVFREKPLRGICQYRRDILPSHAVRDALLTHPAAYIGASLNQDNLFYIPPDLLLETGADASSAQGEWMCQQIIRVLDAERKRDAALKELESLNRDLERRVAERTAELALVNRQLETFAYSVSHDLQAPVRAIKSFCNIITADIGDRLGEDGRGYFERIEVNAERMSELIKGMLTLARVANAPIELRAVDVSRLAREAWLPFSTIEQTRTVDLLIHDDLRARGDATLVRNVLANLLSNAWKFTSKRPSPRIEVGSLGLEGQYRVFFVRDNGVGFEMAQATRLFGGFHRLHHETEFPGTGIGLATVERAITRLGGRVWAEAVVGEGATFYFTLPTG